MIKNIFIGSLIFSGFVIGMNAWNVSSIDMQAVTNCNGTQVVRVWVGRMEVRHVEVNLPGCINTESQKISTAIVLSGSNATDIIASWSTISGSTISLLSGSVLTGSTLLTASGTSSVNASGVILNCNGNVLIPTINGGYSFSHTGVNLPGCISTVNQTGVTTQKVVPVKNPSLINLSNGPLFDIRSTQIAEYRKQLLRDQNIQFANPVRSVRIRSAATKKSQTEAFLMKNDAVVNSGDGIGWDKVQGATLTVSNDQENIVNADTIGRAIWYTASKYLRNPSITDLVRIGQADFAYWSDIAHVRVSHLVNVRSNPWYTAPIVATLENLTPIYILSTVDNWSEVRNESGTIRGYIRSDFLIVDKAQREDNWLSIQ